MAFLSQDIVFDQARRVELLQAGLTDSCVLIVLTQCVGVFFRMMD